MAEVAVVVRWEGPDGRRQSDSATVRQMLRGQAIRALYLIEAHSYEVEVDGDRVFPESPDATHVLEVGP
jgi:hypothetical protein